MILVENEARVLQGGGDLTRCQGEWEGWSGKRG